VDHKWSKNLILEDTPGLWRNILNQARMIIGKQLRLFQRSKTTTAGHLSPTLNMEESFRPLSRRLADIIQKKSERACSTMVKGEASTDKSRKLGQPITHRQRIIVHQKIFE
jgi:hypothetical protein